MRAIIDCPFCGMQNMVPDDTWGKQYTCYNCGKDFVVTEYADCPFCGEKNLVDNPKVKQTYQCFNCGNEFSYGGPTMNRLTNVPQNKRPNFQRKRSSHIQMKHNPNAVPYFPPEPAEDYGWGSPLIALTKVFSYQGRASRWEFNGLLLMMLPCIIASGVIESNGSEDDIPTWLTCVFFYLAACTFACGFRRVNDCENSEQIRGLFHAVILTSFLVLTIPVAFLLSLYLLWILMSTPSK